MKLLKMLYEIFIDDGKYAAYFYCTNCGKTSPKRIEKGVVVKNSQIICSFCGCSGQSIVLGMGEI